MDALDSELDRNLELAAAMKKMLDRERDMLQGDLRERVILHQFHTDAWDSVVNHGTVEDLDEAQEQVSRCYMRLKEFNEIVQRFNEHGNSIVYIPSLEKELGGYGRDELLKILREKSDEIEILLRDARNNLETLDL
ncbi:MAG: hypothetical protein MUP63_03725 [Candidatus Nanohaloarchaeota archaeon QJJ-7]|nr:hypothetical protein [Candidatus Nanohaloarchaeota archaeon QJJ-7]